MRAMYAQGFSLLTAMLAIGVMGALGAGVYSIVSSNQASRTLELHNEQAYLASRAALQYSWAQINTAGNPSTFPTRYFVGHAMNISRTGGRIQVTTQKGTAADVFSVDDPVARACIYALAGTGSATVNMTGSASINAPSCSMYVNSSSSSALKMVGSATVKVLTLNIVGHYSIAGSGSISTGSGTINTDLTAVADPLLAYNVPSYSTCDYTGASYTGSSSVELKPGVYCGGLSISGSSKVTMNPGVYIIDGGNFSVTGSAAITGSDVVIILSGAISRTYARMTITGSGDITLTSPTSGSWAGIAVFQDRKAPTSGTNSITGSTNLNFTGALYFPNQTLSYKGGGQTTSPCTLLIANKITLTGSANINCSTGSVFPF